MVNLKKHRSKTRFSILNKLVIFLGTIIIISGFTKGAAVLYIAKTPTHELTNTMRILCSLMVVASVLITIVMFFTMVKSIKRKDKQSNLSTLFNNTIVKIGDSVKLFDTNTAAVQQMGNKLVSDIKETASTINQIQTIAHMESITETTEN